MFFSELLVINLPHCYVDQKKKWMLHELVIIFSNFVAFYEPLYSFCFKYKSEVCMQLCHTNFSVGYRAAESSPYLLFFYFFFPCVHRSSIVCLTFMNLHLFFELGPCHAWQSLCWTICNRREPSLHHQIPLEREKNLVGRANAMGPWCLHTTMVSVVSGIRRVLHWLHKSLGLNVS